MQGYRPESFGILTNPVGAEWLIKRALRGIPILRVTLWKDQTRKWLNWSSAEINLYTYLIVSSSDCWENLSKKMYNGNHSAPLGIKRRRPVHNHAVVKTPDFARSTWFEAGSATLVPFRLWAHGFQSASGRPGPKQAFFNLYRPV